LKIHRKKNINLLVIVL